MAKKKFEYFSFIPDEGVEDSRGCRLGGCHFTIGGQQFTAVEPSGKTAVAVLHHAEHEGLVPVWVEWNRPYSLNESKADSYYPGVRVVVYARTTALVKFLGEAEPRRFQVSFTKEEEYDGYPRLHRKGWELEELPLE